MPPASTNSKGDTFTFRLDPALKAELTRAASEARIPPAQLVRALVRSHLAEKELQAFEAKARKQSLSIAQRAGDPATDESRVMIEIEADLEDGRFADTWKA
jgi:predicted transcriptional regulator